MRTRMHDDETLTDADLARTLLAAQQPQWADLPLRLVDSYGTDHDVYRLGEDLSLRLPRTAWAATQAEKEAVWLPRLAGLLLAVPQVVALGEPGAGYPHAWSVQTWLPGADLTGGLPPDRARLADDLAGFVRALRRLPIEGAPVPPADARGRDLGRHDDTVARRIEQVRDDVAPAVMTTAWRRSRAAEPPSALGWTHGDLLPGNLLTTAGRLSGVIDWGALNATDPALDLTPCWYVFDGVGDPVAQRYLAALDASTDDVMRARGWAQLQALNALPYYRRTNPGMAGIAVRALRLIADEV